MAAQRVQQGGAQLPVVPHAAGPGPMRIARCSATRATALARHVFVGGNALMLRMLNRYRTELGVTALPAELEATARATIRQLQQDTATLVVSTPRADRRRAGVRRRRPQPDRPQVPDRLPVAPHVAARHRARRAGRHGRSNRAPSTTNGSIRGNDNDADAEALRAALRGDHQRRPGADLRVDPRRSRRRADDGAADGDAIPEGQPPAAARVRQGDRRLPEIGVFGEARERRRFRGRRRSRALPRRGSGAGPYRVEVELRYQSIGYRWAHNLEAMSAASRSGSSRITGRCPRVVGRRRVGSRTTCRRSTLRLTGHCQG